MATERSSHIEPDRHVEMDYVASEADNILPPKTGSSQSLITVYVLPTTGGEIKLQVAPSSKVSSLKSVISNKIKLSRDKIVLLQKNRQLTDGTLEDNLVGDGARLILVPCVEAGLLTLRPEHSVLKALNTLTDAQIDNVLMGRVPLNLSMRLGGHMMFIQLQLTTSQTKDPPHQTSSSSSVSPSTKSTTSSLASKCPQKLNLQMPSFIPTPPHTPNKSTSFVLPKYPTSSIQGSLPTPPSSPEMANETLPSFLPVQVMESELQSTTMGLGRLKLQHVTPDETTTPLYSSITNGSVVVPKHKESVGNTQQYNKLAEASRNLTQTLKQLSTVALDTACKTPEKCEVRHCSKQKNGAVIESLYHHGKGIYSGTFVGSLSPSLQDRNGRPRQNISTIIHILNDLLGASLNSQPSCQSGCLEKNLNQRAFTSQVTKTETETVANDKMEPQDIVPDGDKGVLHSENEVIRGKIEQIQTMLKERKQRKKARREVRSSPYVYPVKAMKDTSVEVPHNTSSLSISHGECMEV